MKERKAREEYADCNRASKSEAREYEEFAIRQLRAAGFRITMPRVQVIRALGFSNRALSAYAIHDAILEANGKIDVVSVYRILATLQEAGLIHHIGVVDGYLPCRLEDAHTADLEHLVCQECGCVTELSLPPSVIKATTEQADRAGFRAEGITVEIVGLCAHCAKVADAGRSSEPLVGAIS